MVSWEALTEIEPYLLTLLDQVKEADTRGGCVVDLWPHLIKPQLRSLVGWEAIGQPHEIRTCEAWDVAVSRLTAAIPYCPPDCGACD
jgi:hypothetical protein